MVLYCTQIFLVTFFGLPLNFVVCMLVLLVPNFSYLGNVNRLGIFYGNDKYHNYTNYYPYKPYETESHFAHWFTYPKMEVPEWMYTFCICKPVYLLVYKDDNKMWELWNLDLSRISRSHGTKTDKYILKLYLHPFLSMLLTFSWF